MSKEYYFEIQNINRGLNFEIQKPVKIDPKKIKLSKEKSINLKIQKLLSKVDLMNYGSEYGEKIILNSTNRNRKIIFKSWYLSDHLIGIEIEHNNLDPSSLEKMKNLF
ncbi:hypothetical protein [uncultured Aquimarina sp.]|uniref:hypothetical protein n=1 Tax=uncultured Aquimarina sp. TaxID=575652 RepID=UPI002639B4A6|nr:hypothetical protein [uncultured Aquimarina sp.]